MRYIVELALPVLGAVLEALASAAPREAVLVLIFSIKPSRPAKTPPMMTTSLAYFGRQRADRGELVVRGKHPDSLLEAGHRAGGDYGVLRAAATPVAPCHVADAGEQRAYVCSAAAEKGYVADKRLVAVYELFPDAPGNLLAWIENLGLFHFAAIESQALFNILHTDAAPQLHGIPLLRVVKDEGRHGLFE